MECRFTSSPTFALNQPSSCTRSTNVLMSLSQMPSNPEVEPPGNAVIDRREWFQITSLCIGDGVIAADREGRVNYLNPVAEKLTGWTLADAAGEEIEVSFASSMRRPESRSNNRSGRSSSEG